MYRRVKSLTIHESAPFEGSRSFKVTDVDISKKLVASACYDKQHVRAYMQLFYARAANRCKNNVFFGEGPLFPPLVQGPAA